MDREEGKKCLAHRSGLVGKVLAKLSVSHMQRQKVRYSFDRWVKRHNSKIGPSPFQYRAQMSPYSLQSHGWWCGSEGARVTSRLFPRPFKQSRPMTCITVPFEEEASSFIVKEKSRRTPYNKREQLVAAKR